MTMLSRCLSRGTWPIRAQLLKRSTLERYATSQLSTSTRPPIHHAGHRPCQTQPQESQLRLSAQICRPFERPSQPSLKPGGVVLSSVFDTRRVMAIVLALGGIALVSWAVSGRTQSQSYSNDQLKQFRIANQLLKDSRGENPKVYSYPQDHPARLAACRVFEKFIPLLNGAGCEKWCNWPYVDSIMDYELQILSIGDPVGHGLLCPLLMIPPHALGENNTKWKLVIFSSHLENLNDEDGIASEIASQFANTSGYVEERFKVDPKSTHQALMGMYTMEILRSNPIGIDVRIVPFINWRKMRQCIAILQASDNNPPLQKQMSQIFVNFAMGQNAMKQTISNWGYEDAYKASSPPLDLTLPEGAPPMLNPPPPGTMLLTVRNTEPWEAASQEFYAATVALIEEAAPPAPLDNTINKSGLK